MIVAVAIQAFAGFGDSGIGLANEENSDDVLTIVGEPVCAIPKRFAHIHPRYKTPSFATLAMGITSITFYVVLSTLISANALADSIAMSASLSERREQWTREAKRSFLCERRRSRRTPRAIARAAPNRLSCERREIARRRAEPGWRAAVLDE